MANAYERGIYKELGDGLAGKLKEAGCKLVVNVDTLQYSFTNCGPALLHEILEMQRIKGGGSILTEFVPLESFVPSPPFITGGRNPRN